MRTTHERILYTRFVNIQPGSRNGVLLVEIVTFEPKYKTIKILASFEVTV